MTTMEDVLAAHRYAYEEESDIGLVWFTCQCGDEQAADDEHEDMDEWQAKHQAEALAAAGFGSQHDAWADGVATALNHAIENDDGITLRLEHLDGRPWTNPYPKVSET